MRTRSARGNIVFAFAIALVLATAYLMREILMLLYVSALFAVVLSPVIRGITHIPIGKWHPGRGLAIFLLLLSLAAAATLFFAFACRLCYATSNLSSRRCPRAGRNCSTSCIGFPSSLTSIFPV